MASTASRRKIFGVGTNDLSNATNSTVYKVWSSMLRRAYSPVYHADKPTYIGVEVCDEWKVLSNFKVWFEQNYVDGWQLDKDILVKGSKLYSPTTCCFVPTEINAVLIAKESKTDLPIGVYFKQRNNKYCAQVSRTQTSSRASGYLGLFDTPEAAFAAYKRAKEAIIEELVEKYKGRLPSRVYDALKNWEILITD